MAGLEKLDSWPNQVKLMQKNWIGKSKGLSFHFDIKNNKEFVSKREEILSMIWDMEEEIMGKEV